MKSVLDMFIMSLVMIGVALLIVIGIVKFDEAEQQNAIVQAVAGGRRVRTCTKLMSMAQSNHDTILFGTIVPDTGAQACRFYLQH